MRKTPVTLGTLSIVFGSLIGAWSILAFFLGPMFSKLSEFTRNLPGQGELQRAQMEGATAAMEAQAGYMKLSATIFLLMSAALVVIGVGLRGRRLWAKKSALAWSALGLLLIVVNTVVAFAWLQPRQREIQHAVYVAHGVTPPFEFGAGSQGALTIFGMLPYVVFPILLLALLGRRSAVNDFPPAA
jgi:hypothetical protein